MNASDFRIVNPFDPNRAGSVAVRGRKVTIPAGTIIRTTHPQNGPVRVAKKTHTVTLHMAADGWIDRAHGSEGKVIFPTISWAGAGGYWCDVQVTPELAAANGIELPDLPQPDEDGRIGMHRMVVAPTYEDGYTNRWAV